MATLLFTFSTQTAEPPTGNQIRLDAAVPADVSKLWVRYTTDDGIDAFYLLEALSDGVDVFLQDKNDHLQYERFRLAGAGIDKGTYFEFPVSYLSGGGATFGNNQTVLFVVPSLAEVPIPPGPHTPLVTVAEAIAHLRLLPTDIDDADLRQKLAAAEATILDYLNTTATVRMQTASWTSATVPEHVRQAILLQLGEYERGRGDDFDDNAPPRDTDRDLSPAIVGLLRRTAGLVVG